MLKTYSALHCIDSARILRRLRVSVCAMPWRKWENGKHFFPLQTHANKVNSKNFSPDFPSFHISHKKWISCAFVPSRLQWERVWVAVASFAFLGLSAEHRQTQALLQSSEIRMESRPPTPQVVSTTSLYKLLLCFHWICGICFMLMPSFLLCSTHLRLSLAVIALCWIKLLFRGRMRVLRERSFVLRVQWFWTFELPRFFL